MYQKEKLGRLYLVAVVMMTTYKELLPGGSERCNHVLVPQTLHGKSMRVLVAVLRN